jgi:hypothetical protein
MLFEEPFQNFHKGLSMNNSDCSHDIERRWCGAKVFLISSACRTAVAALRLAQNSKC